MSLPRGYNFDGPDEALREYYNNILIHLKTDLRVHGNKADWWIERGSREDVSNWIKKLQKRYPKYTVFYDEDEEEIRMEIRKD